jgi:hypothetical protein
MSSKEFNKKFAEGNIEFAKKMNKKSTKEWTQFDENLMKAGELINAPKPKPTKKRTKKRKVNG